MALRGLARSSAGRYGLLLAAYGLYLLLGAAVFSGLESGPELDRLDGLRRAHRRLLAEHRACLSEEGLAGLLERFVRAGSSYSGGPGRRGNGSADERWEVTSALFFAASVLTTTGYGHTMPLSAGGKIFCLLYALVGIPATLLLLACLLQQLLPVLSHRPVRYIHARWGFPLAHVALGHAVALGLATLGLFILVPAICFWALEDRWSFLESVYFCFISLSTIGLDNYVPQGSSGSPWHELYELSITCYLLVGLLAVVVSLETVYQLQQVCAFVQFFAPARDLLPEDDDRQDILAGDQLALATVSRSVSQGPVEGSAT
ncbi:hypothetical protein JRQ81_009509 [Phrynocephalus forsythii]|uniref:Potassium channel subfamily K member n=1 Tax=Phrynocephalus forsythii TaxID=171643 RepID=A0A9Q1ASK5_9SAUR|nr:hypothetical protein JRQ81_009509 [Phrynocephalus forsythii]